MGYPGDMLPPHITDAMNKNTKAYEQMLEKHQKSAECLHTPDCPKCKQIQGWIDASSPTLP